MSDVKRWRCPNCGAFCKPYVIEGWVDPKWECKKCGDRT